MYGNFFPVSFITSAANAMHDRDLQVELLLETTSGIMTSGLTLIAFLQTTARSR